MMESQSAEALTLAWLSAFESALGAQDEANLRSLFFADEAYWRDLLSFTWDAQQFHSVDSILDEMMRQVSWVQPSEFALDAKRKTPTETVLVDLPVVEFFFEFKTSVGSAKGHAFAVQTGEQLRVHVLMTYLDELAGGSAKSLVERHPGLGYEPEQPGQTWAEFRARQVAFEDREPEVLIVGGSQAGSTTAARLGQLGVDTLVIDKHGRPGDAWRNRYESLALHTPTDTADFPYFPFPKTFPKYLPKDKYADYLEAYINLMDLNYWTSATFLGATFNDKTLTWTARVDRDGAVRELHPKHVVICIGGAGGNASIPKLAGLNTFGGAVVHSSQFHAGSDYRGKRALVVGVGTSGHDIALDLYNNGCEVELLQRGSISVAGVETANTAYGDYTTPSIPQAEADIRSNTKFIVPLLVKTLRKYTKWANEADRDLHTGLRDAGLHLDDGEDDTGWLMKFWRYSGGYYLNVGASDVIAAGGISISQFDEFDSFTKLGMRRTDGSERALDLIVLATGFENISASVRTFFGDKIAEAVGPIGGISPDGERNNHARPTTQPHLWFMYGGIVEARRSAPWMTLQIKANLMGAVPSLARGPDGRVHPVSSDTGVANFTRKS